MKVSQVSRTSRRIRVVRHVKPKVRPIKHEEDTESRIRSSVDSWLSSAPSIKEPQVQQTPKHIITKLSTIENVHEKSLFTRCCVTVSAALMILLLVCGIIGIVLAIKLQLINTSETAATNSHI